MSINYRKLKSHLVNLPGGHNEYNKLFRPSNENIPCFAIHKSFSKRKCLKLILNDPEIRKEYTL